VSRLSRTVTIVNQKGLHARASAKFVTFVARLPAELKVEVEKDGQNVAGTSIMGLMMLGAAKGSEITIHVAGEGSDMALDNRWLWRRLRRHAPRNNRIFQPSDQTGAVSAREKTSQT
jgi:phosphocarrier protein